MSMFRTASFVVVTLLAVTAASAQREGDSCDTTSSPDVCSADVGTTLLSCNESNVYQPFPCGNLAAGATCGPIPCTGAGCTEITRCVSTSPGACIGISPLFTDDTSSTMLLPCAPNNACVMNAVNDTETCTALPAGVGNCTVSSPFARCVDDLIVICVAFDDNAVITSPGIRDCGAEGTTCVEDGDNIGCGAPVAPSECGTNGFGSCDGNVAVSCSNGEVFGRSDCSNSGQLCVDNGGTSPECITPDPTCGASGRGSCDGNTATVCVDGVFVNTTDCSSLGRTCGPVDANGNIGCSNGGPIGEGEGENPGEGEGENTDECARNSDCDDDEICDDGECVRERTRGRGGDDEEEEDAGLFACSSTAGAAPFALLGLALLRRRRRR
ncbi:MAG TPA: MYXO-CTERM sorting domain-containing protein [Myxococcota bacterium]